MAFYWIFFFFLICCHEQKASTVVQGSQFGKGSIEIAGIELRQHSTFTKIVTLTGDSGNSSVTFFAPSSLPSGFFHLGSYAQIHTPNPSPPRALIARSTTTSPPTPTDFTLLFSINSTFFWHPICPQDYTAVGHVITTSPQKPPLSSLHCLPNHLLEPCHHQPSFFSLQISNTFGTFIARNEPSLICLKKDALTLVAMPNLTQITALIQSYSPWIHFHPKEPYLPSSISWFFNNGALLYTKSSPNNPTRIDPIGANLPQNGTNDGAYWIDLPTESSSQAILKSGNLSSAETYIHVKPMLGGTATDIIFWLFYPFNGPARAKVKFIEIALGRIGEHVGDWEHVTQRFSNFDGELKQMYFSQHSSGEWVDVTKLSGRRPAAYATLNGHAFYNEAGLVLNGEVEKGIGIMDETKEGGEVMDVAARGVVVSAEYLGVEEPAWLQYMREWGPNVSYDVDDELEKVMRFLPEKIKTALRNLVSRLPKEVFGEEGPTGPKGKDNWNGDES